MVPFPIKHQKMLNRVVDLASTVCPRAHSGQTSSPSCSCETWSPPPPDPTVLHVSGQMSVPTTCEGIREVHFVDVPVLALTSWAPILSSSTTLKRVEWKGDVQAVSVLLVLPIPEVSLSLSTRIVTSLLPLRLSPVLRDLAISVDSRGAPMITSAYARGLPQPQLCKLSINTGGSMDAWLSWNAQQLHLYAPEVDYEPDCISHLSANVAWTHLSLNVPLSTPRILPAVQHHPHLSELHLRFRGTVGWEEVVRFLDVSRVAVLTLSQSVAPPAPQWKRLGANTTLVEWSPEPPGARFLLTRNKKLARLADLWEARGMALWLSEHGCVEWL